MNKIRGYPQCKLHVYTWQTFWFWLKTVSEMDTVKITTVLDSKPTKSVGHFEENKFSVGGHQFLLKCCPKLIKTYNFGQNAVNERQFKNKNEQY
jgi:hypothetical protein